MDPYPAMDYGSIVCCTMAFLLYCNTLSSEFVYDDRRAILTNPDLLPKTPWTRLWQNDFWGTPMSDSGSHGSYRPLSVLSFRLNYLIGGFNPWGYHFVNVLLHCSATYLLILVARRVLPRNRRKLGSVITGALFATHPVHTEAVAGIVGRADLISCNLFFLSLLAYMAHVSQRDSTCCPRQCHHRSANSKNGAKKYEKIAVTLQKSLTSCHWPSKGLLQQESSQNGQKRGQDELSGWCCWKTFVRVWCYVFISVVLAICAMLSKETGITVLGISFVYDYIYARRNSLRKVQTKSKSLGTFVALVAILSLRLQNKAPQFSTADNPTAKEASFVTRLLTFSYLAVFNFWMLVYPSDLSFDWSMDAIPRIKSVRDPRVLYSCAFYSVLMYIVYKSVKSVQTLRCENINAVQKKLVVNSGCTVCCSKISENHSQNCRTANNNNNTPTCSCPGKRQGPTAAAAVLFALSLITLPFVPASNLFFYVGFVVAERVLYVPSAGFCLLVGFMCAKVFGRRHFSGICGAGLFLVLLGFGGKTFYRNNDWKNEETLYRSAIPYNPPKAYGNLGSILNTKGQTLEAEEAFRKALDFRPNMADVHYNLGILLQGKHELDEAIQSYKRAINFRPSLALAYVNLGTALIAAGRCQEAITVLRQGSKLDGSGLRDRREHDTAKISALLQLGALYSDQGRLQRALAAYREAAHNLPEHYPLRLKVYNVLGETLAKMQQDEEAEKWYRAALDAEPDHVAAHITYGKLLAKNMSRSAEAEQWFRKAQRLAPEDASVYHHYGAFLASNRRYKEAATMYEKAAELRQDDYELAVAAATAMRKAGRQHEAEQWYRRAVHMKPTDARGHTNLGAILHLNGKYREAEHSYKEALRLQPDDTTTLTNLQKLHGLMT